jgi:hypothetical protein
LLVISDPLPGSCRRFKDDPTNHSAACWPRSKEFRASVRKVAWGEDQGGVAGGGNTRRGVLNFWSPLPGSGQREVGRLPHQMESELSKWPVLRLRQVPLRGQQTSSRQLYLW